MRSQSDFFKIEIGTPWPWRGNTYLQSIIEASSGAAATAPVESHHAGQNPHSMGALNSFIQKVPCGAELKLR